VRSEAYARARLASAVLFMLLGTSIAVRTLLVAGLSLATIPGCVLAAAMIALGGFRLRDYFASRAAR